MENKSKFEGWKNIISTIDSNLKFLTFLALIFNGLILYFAYRTDSKDSKILFIVSFVGFILFAIIALFFLAKDKSVRIPEIGKSEPDNISFRYDFFIASPMAAIPSNEQYQNYRNKILEVIKKIKSECGLDTFYYAGEKIDTIEKFEAENISVQRDMDAIKNSKYFILIYLEKFDKPSSVIFEAGIALSLGKKSIYFGLDDNFPFLMKQADQAFSHVKIFKANSHDDVLKLLENNGKNLFDRG